MNWQHLLMSEETILWEGRPAPRCWTFRNWRHSLFGMVLLAIAAWWQAIGFDLLPTYGLWVVLVPLPIVVFALYLTVGHFFLARWQWNGIYYALTEQRLLISGPRKRVYPLSALTWLRLERQGEQLGTFVLAFEQQPHYVRLSCIEYPDRLLPLLEAWIKSRDAVAGGENV